ncbi:hypothetical protein BC936DRAFT_146919 [Jimgerdemannia flammicorona]|uniref:CYRIA/CYRIB Rac1 binding domain-containing protein n=1 Tax=Jimgerdemannia flammicorona TaxID=994334 RepID=A0A433D6J2_9FUNG|nr:hypothetical protein BC936DRAFT_146919 [Jimgerdemannia flammicorona]
MAHRNGIGEILSSDAVPTEDEVFLYQQISQILIKPAPALLDSLRQYVSASEQIRCAIGNPNPQNEDAAWHAVLPIVGRLKKFYEYAADVEESLPPLLSMLCNGDVARNLEQYQALAKLFADILDFVFEFDYLKMRNASLQNDFSYYRRMLQRGRQAPPTRGGDTSDMRTAMLEDDIANRISLFIAYPTPMLKCVIDTTTQFVNEHRLQRSVCECLATLWAACCNAVTKKKPMKTESIAFCLKVMVVSIILYDHIDPQGAFGKTSPINIKTSVKAIQGTTLPQDSSASNLMSALRYNSKHLNDEATPKATKTAVLATA